MHPSAKTTIHLIRHGDAVPEPDAEIDPERGYDLLGLSVKGRRQAANLATRLRNTTPLTAVYSSADVRARAGEAVEDIVRLHPDEHVALVSHAGTINAYLASVLGTTRDFFFPTGNTSLSTVRFEDGRALVVRINDTAHLEKRRAILAD